MDISNIVEIIIALFTGGGITYFVNWRANKIKAKEEAKQSENQTLAEAANAAQQSASNQIEQTNKIIEMYKQSVHDLNELHAENEAKLKAKIDQLEKSLREANITIDKQKLELEDLRHSIDRMKQEIENIRKESDRNCDYCAFAKDCKKKIALETQRSKNNKGKGKK